MWQAPQKLQPSVSLLTPAIALGDSVQLFIGWQKAYQNRHQFDSVGGRSHREQFHSRGREGCRSYAGYLFYLLVVGAMPFVQAPCEVDEIFCPRIVLRYLKNP